jgi:ADP-ribose pyrophosphatase YjhB (NUDIX family)
MRTSIMDTQTPTLRVHALIGQDDRLLLIPGQEPDTYTLPGGAVLSGTPIEHGLCETVHQQLGAAVDDVDFYSVVEHSAEDCDDAGHRLPGSGVVFLFDVALTDPGHLALSGAAQHVWIDERELSAVTLRPKAVKDCLLRAPLSPTKPWWAWTP